MDWPINTAGSAIFGPFIKASNGTGFLTGIGSSPTGYLKKGDRSVVTFNPSTWRHAASGMFMASLSAGVHNKYGDGRIWFAKPSTYLEVWENFKVKSQTAYKMEYSSGAVFDGSQTLTQFSDAVLSLARGKWKASGSDYIMYKQDNVTELFRFTLTVTGRNRV